MTRLERFLERIAATSAPVLVASDFDGTLTEIAERPELPQLGERVRALLSRLTRSPRVQVAILTGRTFADASGRLEGIGPHWLSAEHGALLVDPERRIHRAPDRVPEERLATLKLRAAEIAHTFPGVVVENKTFGVALHYRDVERAHHGTLLQLFRFACAAHRAEVLSGRKVIEGRFAESDKGVALARILAELPRDVAFVYAGDDLTDEPAISLASLSETGLGLYVRSKERPTPNTRVSGMVDAPADWHGVLERIAQAVEMGGQRAS